MKLRKKKGSQLFWRNMTSKTQEEPITHTIVVFRSIRIAMGKTDFIRDRYSLKSKVFSNAIFVEDFKLVFLKKDEPELLNVNINLI